MKYKFWDKKEKKMYVDCPNFAVSSEGKVSELKCHDDDYFDGVVWLGTAYSEHIIPLLCTGLTDKNGEEICEGDIVQIQGEKPYIVAFNDGCFDVVHIRGTWRDYLKCWTCNHAVEVIGNIYENPELLEVSNVHTDTN